MLYGYGQRGKTMLKRFTTALFLAVIISGCGTTTPQQVARPMPVAIPAEANDQIKQALYAQYREWRGTPYEYGGLSRTGIDCSGFVYLTLQDRFGSNVPRTTAAQADSGRVVPHSAWQPGDLVFFQTGHRKHHVGIYVENGYFLHASASEGVTLSSLETPYWKSRYWTTRRLNL